MKPTHITLVLAAALTFAALSPAMGERAGRDGQSSGSAERKAKKAIKIARKALKQSKTPGPPGPTGPAGPAGSALAFARVSGDGAVDQAKGVGANAVTEPEDGIYCFDLSFTPRNVVASTTQDLPGMVATFTADGVSGLCGDSDSAQVITANSNGGVSGRGFFVLFN